MNSFTKLSGLVLGLALVASCANTPSNSDSISKSGSISPSKPVAQKPADSPAVGTKEASLKRTNDVIASRKGEPIYYPSGVRDGAAMTIEKMVPDEVAVGRPFDYMIKVTNISGAPLEAVAVKETLDENFALTASSPKGTQGAGRQLAFDVGTLQAGQSKTITLTGSAAKPGIITSCATLDYTIPSCASINVTAPGLAITKTMTSEALICDAITGKITVSNPGSGITKGVQIKDALVDGLMTSDGKKSIDIDVGTLKAGESREFPFTLKADKTGKFTNMATAMADGNLKADSQAVTVTVHQPVLSVKVECPAGPLMIGRPGTYKFTVKNTGDAPSANSVLTATVPSSMKFKSADNTGSASGERCVWNLGTLAPNETRTVSAVYQNTGAGSVTARVQLSGACAAEVRDQCETSIQGVADIGTLLTDDVGVTTVGEGQVYRCEVANQGQIDLTNVKVLATWPSELEWVATDVQGTVASANKSEFNIGTVKVGERKKFTFTLKAKGPGEFKISTDTTAKEIKNGMHQDEITTFIER